MNGRLNEHDVACHRAGGFAVVKIWECLIGKIETENFDDEPNTAGRTTTLCGAGTWRSGDDYFNDWRHRGDR